MDKGEHGVLHHQPTLGQVVIRNKAMYDPCFSEGIILHSS